jgi:hypothetical protein
LASTPDVFVRRVLAGAAWKASGWLVLEGLRHKSVLVALQEFARPATTRLLYVKASWDVRRLRVQSEDGADLLARWSEHPVESEVERLEGQADLVVLNDGVLQEAARTVMEWVDFVARESPGKPV